jgi:exonuclease SbcD
MKILHTADWHVGRSIRGRNRSAEQRAVLQELLDCCAREACDVVLVCGDLFENSVPSPEAEEIVYATLLGFAERGARVVLIAGNHDNPLRLSAVAPLLERAGSMLSGTHVQRPEQGGLVEITTRSGETARLALFPFVPKSQLIRSADLMAGQASNLTQTYRQVYAQMVALFVPHFAAGTVNLALAHVMIDQAERAGGERDVHSIFDYSVPASIFNAPRLQYVALGHVHKCQPVPSGCPAWYPGSPLQLEFGDPDLDKHYLLIDVEPGLPAEVRRGVHQAGRRLRRVQGKLETIEAGRELYGDDYLQVILEEAPRPGLGRLAREALPNAIDIRIVDPSPGSLDVTPLPEGPPEKLFEEFLRERGRLDDKLLALFRQLLEQLHEA